MNNIDVTTLDSTNLESLGGVARELIGLLPETSAQAALVTLGGDLGAGKTTLVQHIAKHLGVTESVSSPTFVIEQRYPVQHPVFKTLVHIDAYRLEQADDPEKIGLVETLADPTNLVIIEWPERIKEFLQNKNRLVVDLVFDAATGTRTISYRK